MSVNKAKYKIMKDVLDSPNGSVLSISGPWGVGKTHFWKMFMEQNNDSLVIKKYGYVSLFGIESLDSLKIAIAGEVALSASEESAWYKK